MVGPPGASTRNSKSGVDCEAWAFAATQPTTINASAMMIRRTILATEYLHLALTRGPTELLAQSASGSPSLLPQVGVTHDKRRRVDLAAGGPDASTHGATTRYCWQIAWGAANISWRTTPTWTRVPLRIRSIDFRSVAARVESGAEVAEYFFVVEIDLPNDNLGPMAPPPRRTEQEARVRLSEFIRIRPQRRRDRCPD
jgi:hypothetical protein